MNWKDEALKLSNEGHSGRKIAKMLGKGRTSVLQFLRKQVGKEEVPETSFPKVLFIDVELKPFLFQGWAMFDQNFGLEQIQEDWSILSYSAKWLHSDEVIYSDVTEKTEDELLYELHSLLNEAHFIVGHNAKRFDLPKIRARMIARGLPPHSPVRVIDTLHIARQEFKFSSNKLAYLTQLLCKSHVKGGHEKFSGHKLWKEFLKGNPEAITAMREYNMLDVTSLEELYFILAPWSSKLPMFEVYVDAEIDMSNWVKEGYCYTNFGKYEQFKNVSTGQYRRGRKNLLSKEKRSELLANIA